MPKGVLRTDQENRARRALVIALIRCNTGHAYVFGRRRAPRITASLDRMLILHAVASVEVLHIRVNQLFCGV
jgi:hypothetical protein